MRLTLISSILVYGITTVFCDASISKFPNALSLPSAFDPLKAAYWTGLPHHRRTPFSVSPDGKSAYLAYLDSTFENVVVQKVDVSTFSAVGVPITVKGFEAAGLVAQDDGFALLATVPATGTTDLPPNGYPIVSLIRYKDNVEAWRTPMNGPGVHAAEGLTATPDANGDLVYSSKSGLYAAYFVVTAYTGWAAGHFGDSIQYVDDSGKLQAIPSASVFGCSHNTGIGLEAADEPPYASVCAEDHGAIWLNTDTRTMSGIKIANENATNGASGEPMGGMSGSYSNLARFPSTSSYVFAWQSRGAVNLVPDSWMGAGYTASSPRWLNHNVAIATMSSKNKLAGAQASSTVGAADGDSQVNWITKSATEDHQNVHVAAINSKLSLVTWETLTNPNCQPVPLGCTGTYAGTSFQLVDSTGAKVGGPVTSKDVFVSGDIVSIGTDKVCWPYVDMTWDLSKPKASADKVTKMSFACASLGGSSEASPSPTSSPAALSTTLGGVSSSAVVAPSSGFVRSSTVLGGGTSSAAATTSLSSTNSSKVTLKGTSDAERSTSRAAATTGGIVPSSSGFQTIRKQTSHSYRPKPTSRPAPAPSPETSPVQEGEDDVCSG